jgi:hypothetical protein
MADGADSFARHLLLAFVPGEQDMRRWIIKAGQTDLDGLTL